MTLLEAHPQAPPRAVSPGPAGRLRDMPVSVVLIVAGLMVMVYSGNTKEMGFPIGPERLLVGAGVVFTVLDARRTRLHRGLVLRPVHFFLIAMLGLAFYSAAEHHTLKSSIGFYALFDRLGVMPFLLFALAPLIFRTSERRDLLLKGLVVVGLYLSVTAIFETTGPSSLVWPRYIADPNYGIHFGRARGPFVESVTDGVVMTWCAAAAALAVTRMKGAWRVLAALTVPLCLLGTLLTLTRAVWIGTGLGVVLAMAASPKLRKLLIPVAGVSALGVVLALAFIPGLSQNASSRADDNLSVWDRLNGNAAAIRIMEHKPLTGVGWEKFLPDSPEWLRQADSYPITNDTIEVHNVPLARAAELGVPGLGLWFACLASGPGLGIFRRRRVRTVEMEGWRLVLIVGSTSWFVATLLSPLAEALPNALVWLVSGIALTDYLTLRGSDIRS